jgi:hypothetical protein
MTTLATPRTLPPAPRINFTWSPVGSAIAYTFSGNNYPPAGTRFEAFFTPINQLITFVSVPTVSPDAPIIEYRWDLGDGMIKYGSTVGHTYVVPNPSLTAKLEVIDSLGRKAYVAKVLLLQVQFPTQATSKARVAP